MDLRSGHDRRSSARAILGLALAAALLMGLAAPLHALVIDDFEDGPFSLFAPPGASAGAVQTGLAAIHCIATERDVRLHSLGSDPAGAQLNLVAVNDEVATVMPGGGGGRLELRYRPATPVDLTAGGVLVKIVAQVTVAVPGGASLEITLEDAAGLSDVEAVAITAPGPFYEIPLSGYAANLNRAAIRSIQVTLSAPVQGDYHLADLRMAKPYSTPLAYDAVIADVSGPPYPTAPLEFGVDILPPDLAEPHAPLQRLQIALLEASECLPPDPCVELPIRMRGMDSGDGAVRIGAATGARLLADHGDHGFTAEAHLLWDGGPGLPPPDDRTRFELRVQLLPDGGLTPMLLAPPKMVVTARTIAIFYRVAHRDRIGFIRAISDHEMGVVTEFGDLEHPVPEVSSCSGLLDDCFRIGFTIEMDAPPDPVEPLVVVTLRGDRVGEGAVGVGDLAPSRAQRLWAQPTLMRGATDFRLGWAVERATSLVIHDLQGRALRRLEIPRGASRVAWDGLDGEGNVLSPGVYLARLVDGRTFPVARVVRLD